MSKLSQKFVVTLIIILAPLLSCSVTTSELAFKSSFETIDDFQGYYIVPNKPNSSTGHKLDRSVVLSGQFSYHAWINHRNIESDRVVNRNHRAYPTIQFQKNEGGSLKTPVCVSIYVWADFNLLDRVDPLEDQWFSLATFTDDETDHWRRTVLVNVSYEGKVHLQHVPFQGQQQHIFQSNTHVFPYKEWAHLEIELDFSETGYAKVWLNNELQSHAKVKGIKNHLAQAHFGLYASPSLESGVIRNDDLTIWSGKCHTPSTVEQE